MTYTTPREMTATEILEHVQYNESLLVMLNESLDMWTKRGDNEHELERAAERVKAVNRRLAELRHETGRREAEAVRRANMHYGPTIRASYSGTRHFVNVWDETFCGRDITLAYRDNGDDRATCKNCCKAGDAAMRDGTWAAGGSAARRN